MRTTAEDTATKTPLYRRRAVVVPAIVVGIFVIALGWWLCSPLFLDRTVVEDFPGAALADVPAEPSPQEVAKPRSTR